MQDLIRSSEHLAKIKFAFGGCLGPPVVPFLTPFLREGSPTKTDYRKKGTLVLTSLLDFPVTHHLGNCEDITLDID